MYEWRNGSWGITRSRERQTLEGNKFTYTTSVDCKFGDKTSVTTKAGEFECYKLMITQKMSSAEVSEVMYYSPKAGFIKIEPAKREKANIFLELVSVKTN